MAKLPAGQDGAAASEQDEAAQAPADEFEKAFDEFAAGKPADGQTDDDAGKSPPDEGRDDGGEGDGEGDGQGAEANADADADDAAGKGDQEGDGEKKPAQQKPDGKQPAGDGGEGKDGSGKDAAAEQKAWLEGLAPEVRERVEAIQREADLKVKRMSGTVSGLTRKATRLEGELREARTRPSGGSGADAKGGKPSQAKANDLLKGEGWQKFREEYSEVAGPVEQLIGASLAKIENLERVLAGMSSDQRDAFYDTQEAAVEEAHPDYVDAFKSDAFKRWYDQAPQYIRKGVERNGEAIVDGGEVSHLLSLFKADTGWKSPTVDPKPKADEPSDPPAKGGQDTQKLANRRERQLRSGTHVPGKGGGAAEGPPNDFEAAFDYFAARQK